MSILRELFDRVWERAEGRRSVTLLEDTPDSRRFLVYHGDGEPPTEYETKKCRPEFDHVLASFASLVSYVERDGGPTAELYVNQNMVSVQLSPESNLLRRVELPLTKIRQYAVFHELFSPQPQERWMRELRSTLADCFDPGLAVMMRGIEVGRSGVKSVQVDDTGMVASKSDLAVKVTTNDGVKTLPLKTDWTYNGPLWRCVPDLLITVQCVLQCEDSPKGVNFVFVPKTLDVVLDDALRRLMEQLEAALPSVPVYNGTPRFMAVDQGERDVE